MRRIRLIESPPGRGRRLTLLGALVSAALGGFLLDVATPDVAWWPAAFLGAGLVLLATWLQSARRGALVGLLAGAVFWFPHISWLTLYLGPIPWLALGTVMTAWFGLFGAAAAATTSGLARFQSRGWATWTVRAVQVVAVTGLWVLREQLQSEWPYGGFAWGRLAHTQVGGPFAELVSWVGFSGLSAFVAAVSVFVPLIVLRDWRATRSAAVSRSSSGGEQSKQHSSAPAVSVAAVAVLAVIAAAFVPIAPLEPTGTLRVAAVQGNSKSGIFDNRDSGDVFRDHVEATEALIESLDADGERVDVIVWPENSAEFDIHGNRFGGLQLSRLSRLADAPIVVGSVLPRDGGEYTNSSLVWGPDGPLTDAHEDPIEYDKRYPVPFAEYMPHRSFYHALVPELVDLVQLEYSAGTLPSAVDIPLERAENPVDDGADGSDDDSVDNVVAGLAICFDIIFDRQATEMIDDGAEVIFAQTNNADFGRTDESAQQLQIAHLRAMEMGRALVNISTVGTSAIILPDASVVDQLPPFTRAAMVAEVPVQSGSTPALRYGAAIAGVLMGVGIIGLAAGIALQVADRRSARNASDAAAAPA